MPISFLIRLFIFHFLFFIFHASLFSVPSLAFDQKSLLPLIKRYESGKIRIGLHVVSLNDGETLFAYNEALPLNPASNIKIITSAAALSTWGGDHTFKTRFSTESAPKNGIIGNLYVKGGGDPSIVQERLWRMAKDLSIRGIKEIREDIVIDQGLFDSSNPDKDVGDPNRAYNAPLSPFALNFNSFSVMVVPTEPGQPAFVSVDPDSPYFDLKGRVTTGGGKGLAVSRRFRDQREFVSVSGTVSGKETKIVYRSATDPTLYAGWTLKKYLQQNGVSVSGGIREGSAEGGHLLLEDRSKSLKLILQDLNKFSNNFTAEMLVKGLGSFKGGTPGTTLKGITVVAEYLDGLGIPKEDYHLENGSGLSRETRVTPRVLTRILSEVYHRFEDAPEFLSSLSIAGVDGTAKSRFRTELLRKILRVKTGTLNDASSLSGYISTRNGKHLAFALLVAGPGAGAPTFHQLQEKMALMLVSY